MLRGAIDTPVGPVFVGVTDGQLVEVGWGTAESSAASGQDAALLNEALSQLRAYFDGALRKFDLPMLPPQTSFAADMRAEMLSIPYGETRTYGQIAKSLAVPAQTVGQACGANPLPIIVPCHRVLGSNGTGGFSGMGGVETKISLLRHEGGYSFLI